MADKPSEELRLDSLAHDYPNIPPEGGAMMAQAAVVCLDHQGHGPGVKLMVDGSYTGEFPLAWSQTVSGAIRRFWRDLEEATEQGAYAVGILLMRALTGYTIIERSRKGTGFDWWLGNEDNLFQGKARLEVSGILRGSRKRINARIKARIEQTSQSDDLGYPAYVVVVEFGNPQAMVHKR
jgi:hypothetical protein